MNRFIRKQFYILVGGLVWMGSLSSCRHETDPEALSTISFSGRVQPIIQSNCAKSGCHDGGEQFDLTSYESITRKVEPGKPNKSEIYKSMTYLDNFRVMPPKPDSPLTEDQLKVIYTWILQGAKNN